MDSLSDEEWLVQNARSFLKSNPYAAKAWLITAKTLFPTHFEIQFEAFSLEKNERNTREAAKLLEEMFVSFPQDSRLWNQVACLAEALQSENTDKSTLFLRELFDALPASLQCHILLRIAETTADVLQRCRLVLLVLARYPDRVPEQGVLIIDVLLSAEKHSSFAAAYSPVNCYRKYLVCDVLPLVLSTRRAPAAAKHLYRWLQKAIEFYICYVSMAPVMTDTLPSPESTTKPARHYSGGAARLKRMHIAGLSDSESIISQPWQRLFDLVKLMGRHLSWNIGDLFELTSCELQCEQLCSQTSGAGVEEGVNKEQLYCTTVLFLHYVVNYTTRTCDTAGSPIVLVQAFTSDPTSTNNDHRNKRQKTESLPPVIHASKTITDANQLIQNFMAARKCWDLLHSSSVLEKDFNKLCQYWKLETWDCIKSFEVETLIYKGFFKEAITMLQASSGITKKQPPQLRSLLQMACSYFCLGNFMRTCETTLQVVECLDLNQPSGQGLSIINGPGRNLQLMHCDSSEVLPYCVHMLITCFREKAFKTYAPDDMSLGHMIVLLQYDWPRYEDLFDDCLKKIQKQGNFTYNIFFNYVINIDILEEFAYLKTDSGGKVNLDILPISTKAIAQSRTVTRGVNKGVTEDFKVALERQVLRSDEQMESVMRQFLTDERDILQQSLA